LNQGVVGSRPTRLTNSFSQFADTCIEVI
jgi:hypothetical protein